MSLVVRLASWGSLLVVLAAVAVTTIVDAPYWVTMTLVVVAFVAVIVDLVVYITSVRQQQPRNDAGSN